VSRQASSGESPIDGKPKKTLHYIMSRVILELLQTDESKEIKNDVILRFKTLILQGNASYFITNNNNNNNNRFLLVL
jgi:hypothetical protein